MIRLVFHLLKQVICLVWKTLSLVVSVRVWFTSFYVRAGNTCYVSETSRHLFTHLREHLVSDRTSHIFKHLHNSPQCRTLRSDECFRILDYDSTTFQLKIKEAIHIQWKQPTLNHQIYHVNLKLSLSMLTSFFYYCFLSNQHFAIHFKFNKIRTEDDRRTVETCF